MGLCSLVLWPQTQVLPEQGLRHWTVVRAQEKYSGSRGSVKKLGEVVWASVKSIFSLMRVLMLLLVLGVDRPVTLGKLRGREAGRESTSPVGI